MSRKRLLFSYVLNVRPALTVPPLPCQGDRKEQTVTLLTRRTAERTWRPPSVLLRTLRVPSPDIPCGDWTYCKDHGTLESHVWYDLDVLNSDVKKGWDKPTFVLPLPGPERLVPCKIDPFVDGSGREHHKI